MNNTLRFLRKNAGSLVQLQLKDKFRLSHDEVAYYKSERMEHPLVKEVFSWQEEDGYIGNVFHGGWLPENKKIRSSKAFEVALRFLYEASFTEDDEIISLALQALKSDDFNRSYSSWDIYSIEDSLYGDDVERAYLLMLFSDDEEIDWVQQSIHDALDAFRRLSKMEKIEDGLFRDNKGRLVVNKHCGVPDLYHLRLLAHTTSWRHDENIGMVGEALEKWFSWEIKESIYANYQGQRIAMARLRYIPDASIKTLNVEDWNRFFEIMSLVKRLGMTHMKAYQKKRQELLLTLENNDGVFDLDVNHKSLKTWGAYSGIRLEDKWTKTKRQVDLSYRVYSICY